jgi:Tol biopolymer transport system component/predicted Ser/Thr protein kinase
MIGKTLGHYRVGEQLGRGGMGEVYLADDLNLNRKVALKFLPDVFTGDPERMARFEREAKLLASLNHPNIAAIYGLEQAEGKRFIVMELVEGETLAQRISKGPLPVEEALGVCRQIAEGLEAAHEKGVIHRDLKPANVMITEGDKVKILDFGLAKALSDETQSVDSSQSPTLTEAMTRPGVILGTAAYMSPEQAKGKSVDKRADIWAFGCILYESLTGKRVFEGETVTETLAGILKSEPDWSALPASTPQGVRTLLRRCLKKDPKQRFRDASDIRIQIEEALAAPAEGTPGVQVAAPPKTWRRLLPWVAAAFGLGLLLAGLVLWNLLPARTTQPVSRAAILLPPDLELVGMAALSPDGKYLAYAAYYYGEGKRRLYLRAMDSFESKAIPRSEDAGTPFFSPDSQWIGFTAISQINKVAVAGGAIQKICDISIYRGAAWNMDGTIAFTSRNSGLLQVSSDGGVPRELTRLKQEGYDHRWPQFLPDGKTILFTECKAGAAMDDSSIVAQRLNTGEQKILIRGGTCGRYVPTGHLVYYRAGALMAVPFDATRLEVSGTPVGVIDNIRGGDFGLGMFSFSGQGSLVYMPRRSQIDPWTLVWVDRKGTARPLPAPPGFYHQPSLSPDGQKLALTINSDIWIYDISRNAPTRLTFDESSGFPLWTPDGKRIVYRSKKTAMGMYSTNLFWRPADGSGSEERLTTSDGSQTPASFSPDGKILIYEEMNPKTYIDIWMLPIQGERKPQPIIQTRFNDRAACFSPDGRWLAYLSDESGRYEVYVKPFPGPGGKQKISTEGASEILWGKNGELTYRASPNREKMMAVNIRTQPDFKAEKPRLLFEGPYLSTLPANTWRPAYSVSADGQRFLMFKGKENPQNNAATQINLIQNWFEELKQKVPVK